MNDVVGHHDSEQEHHWYGRCVSLLVRREHSYVELVQKLIYKGCPASIANKIADRCLQQDYLSLSRFAESMSRNKALQGYGPNYVSCLLKQHEIPDQYIRDALEVTDWQEARKIAVRKIGDKPVQKVKQSLYRRGFMN